MEENIKMRIKSIIIFVCISILAACTAQKELGYALPAEMLPQVKAEYAKRCEQGAALYKMSCGKCHNIKKGRKEIIPDFRQDQLIGYTLRVSNAQHEANMPDSLVTEEELGIIMTFLGYKKKSNIPAINH